MPPIALFRIVILSGNRHLNSLDPLAAIYEPMKIPRTKKTPQSINLVSPVIKSVLNLLMALLYLNRHFFQLMHSLAKLRVR